MIVLGHHRPHNHCWCVVVGPICWANSSTSTVESLLLDQCQHVNNDVLPRTPLPNVGPTIAYIVSECFLFVCLGGLLPTWEIFTDMEMSPLPVKGSKFWPMLGTNGHRVTVTYCDTGHPFTVVIPEDPWHSHLLPSVWQLSLPVLRLRSVASGIRTPNLPLAGRMLHPTAPPLRLIYRLSSLLSSIDQTKWVYRSAEQRIPMVYQNYKFHDTRGRIKSCCLRVLAFLVIWWKR